MLSTSKLYTELRTRYEDKAIKRINYFVLLFVASILGGFILGHLVGYLTLLKWPVTTIETSCATLPVIIMA